MKKKIVKLSQYPALRTLADRKGVPTGLLGVNGKPFFLSEDFWQDIREFEAFPLNNPPMIPPLSSSGGVEAYMEKCKDFSPEAKKHMEDLERMLKRSNSQIWQFNAYTRHPSEMTNESVGTDYVPQIAIFGTVTIVPHTLHIETLRKTLLIYSKLYNFWSAHFGPAKRYKSDAKNIIL